MKSFLGSFRASLSLGQRVAILLVAAFTVFLTGFLHLSISSRAADTRKELEETGRSSLELIERAVAEQALIGDYAAIQAALDACARRRDVESVEFWDNSGKSLLASSRPEDDAVPAWIVKVLPELETGLATKEVRLGGVRYGVLVLDVDDRSARNRLYRAALAQIAVSFVFVVVILGLMWLPLRGNLRALLQLESVTRRFERGEYEARVDFAPWTPPELRQTAKAFNAMGEKIGGLLTALSEQRRAIDNAAILVEMDLAGVIASVNGRFLLGTGLTGEEVVGRLFPEILLPAPGETNLPPDWVSLALGGAWRG